MSILIENFLRFEVKEMSCKDRIRTSTRDEGYFIENFLRFEVKEMSCKDRIRTSTRDEGYFRSMPL